MPDEQSHVETASLHAPAGAKSGFAPGTRVGDYEVLNAIGAGGMGAVYRVRNVISDRIEAMKVLLPSLSEQGNLEERFTREIKVQAAMQHPNIAGLHTAFHFNNQLVMIMQYVEGVSLEERVRQGPLPLADCLAYMIQVLQALSYAHQRGVIHRDIKPSNIMVTPDGTVKLMDFGIANVAKDPKLTGTGMAVGSPYYMAPEQVRGETPDPRADIYSLGITLYELVTGRRPFNGDSQFSIMAAHLNDVPTPPIALDHTLPPGLNEIILMAIAKQPEQRFQTADAFLNALQSVRVGLAGAPPQAAIAQTLPRPVPLPAGALVPGPAPSNSKSHRGLYMALGAVAAIIVLAVAALEAPKFLHTSAQSQSPAPVAAPVVPKPTESQPAPAASEPTPVVSEPVPVPAPVVSHEAQPLPVNKTAPMRSAISQLPRAVNRALPPAAQAAPAGQPPQQQAPAPTPPAAPPAPAVSTADLQNLEDRLAHLSARMGSLDRTLQRLEQSQNASGLGLRSDFVQSRDMMHSFAGQAEAALRNQDIPAATRYLDRAEIQVDKLAKALNQ